MTQRGWSQRLSLRVDAGVRQLVVWALRLQDCCGTRRRGVQGISRRRRQAGGGAASGSGRRGEEFLLCFAKRATSGDRAAVCRRAELTTRSCRVESRRERDRKKRIFLRGWAFLLFSGLTRGRRLRFKNQHLLIRSVLYCFERFSPLGIAWNHGARCLTQISIVY